MSKYIVELNDEQVAKFKSTFPEIALETVKEEVKEEKEEEKTAQAAPTA